MQEKYEILNDDILKNYYDKFGPEVAQLSTLE
jgi:DnaJ-class molecular chaperone